MNTPKQGTYVYRATDDNGNSHEVVGAAAYRQLETQVAELREALASCANGCEVVADMFEAQGITATVYRNASKIARAILEKTK